MKRDIGLKPREEGNLPPEKLRDILSRIYPEETVEELMDRFVERPNRRKENKHERIRTNNSSDR